MKTVIVTGSGGLVGSECVWHFAGNGYRVVGIDNDTRKKLFGADASVAGNIAELGDVPDYEHRDVDIRNENALEHIFKRESNVVAVIHCAAQPSHDWAASNPVLDFEINARGTLNLLEATRRYCRQAAFVYMSTNKVYGDSPNLIETIDILRSRIEPRERFVEGAIECVANGFDESTSIDQSKHSLFGCSKLAADLYVQEYGRYFGMKTVCFRGGCLTGPAHTGTKLHGFLSYLVKCCVTGEPYTVIGYGGKQVRDNIHSADLVRAFDFYIQNPKPGAVYNIGGGRENACSVLEAIALAEEITGKKMSVSFEEKPREGDHKWWITDFSKFQQDYPEWKITKSLRQIVTEIAEAFERKAAA